MYKILTRSIYIHSIWIQYAQSMIICISDILSVVGIEFILITYPENSRIYSRIIHEWKYTRCQIQKCVLYIAVIL